MYTEDEHKHVIVSENTDFFSVKSVLLTGSVRLDPTPSNKPRSVGGLCLTFGQPQTCNLRVY